MNKITLDYVYSLIDKTKLQRDYFTNPLIVSKNGKGVNEYINRIDLEYLYNILTIDEIALVCNCNINRVNNSIKKYKLKISQTLINNKYKRRSMYLHGVNHPAQLIENINKVKSTKYFKYKDENYNNLEKQKQTILNKYGKSNSFQVEEFKKKAKNTIKEKYGEEIYQKTNIFKNKYKNTCLNRYGVDNYAKTNECKLKIKDTCLEKYGKNHPMQVGYIKDKMFESRFNSKSFESKPEREVKDFLISLNINPIKYKIGEGDSRIEIDLYIPEKNIGIEFNGVWWHSINNKRPINQHYKKSIWANDNGIELIHIWEDQWKAKKELIKTILQSRLGVLNDNKRIYARQCEIREITNKDYKEFCEVNHIQGYRPAKIKLGLYYNNILVQIASFSKTRNVGKAKSQNSKYEYEWVRGCPASNNVIIGGTSKLFKYFVKKYNPVNVLCYADWNLFNGKGYKECGFKFIGYTGPDKFFVIPNSNPLKRVNRNPYKYKEFKELVKNNKLLECYGAGSLKFVWENLTNIGENHE